MKVKICGVRRAEDVRACVAAGADLVGLNFAPSSRRCLSLAEGRALAAVLPPATGVAVFQDADLQTILDVVDHTGLRVVQLHGRLPAGAFAALSGRVTVFRAVGPSQVAERHAAISAYLVDSPDPGSGTPWAWADRVRGPTLHGVPVLLAGGLTPESVGAAVRACRPAGVDVASGIEGPDRLPHPERIFAFVRAARAAATESP